MGFSIYKSQRAAINVISISNYNMTVGSQFGTIPDLRWLLDMLLEAKLRKAESPFYVGK